MKRMLSLSVLALVSVLVSSLTQPARAQYYDQDREVSYQTFYDELSPHGRWVDYPGVGYVWLPDAGPDFRPYSTNGHWVWTEDYEWMWVSDYDWGWAPFHYGRWDQDPSYGWYWVPGYEWSPAWVAWRDGGDYYGWAPIRPGINISVNFNIGGYAPPVDFWCFAPRRYITSPRIWDYCVDRRRNVTIINYTTVIVNNYSYNNRYGFRSGPRRYDAERYCGSINPVRFRNSNQPGRSVFRNNEVSVYRPNVRRDDNRTLAPRSFERYDRNNSGGFRNNNGNDNRFDRNNTGGYRNNPDRNRDNNDNRPDRNNTGGYRNNPGNNDNRFDRDNTGGYRNNPGNNNNNRPERNNGNNPNRNERDNTGGYRNNPNNDRPVFENTPPTRRFERDIPNNDRPTRNNRDVTTPEVRPDRNPPGNNGGNDRNDRRFERMERPQNTDRPMRQPETRMPETRPQRQPETRMPETRPQRQPETRMPETRPQRQVERRPDTRESQPSRQFERRDNRGGGNNNSGNEGRRRF